MLPIEIGNPDRALHAQHEKLQQWMWGPRVQEGTGDQKHGFLPKATWLHYLLQVDPLSNMSLFDNDVFLRLV